MNKLRDRFNYSLINKYGFKDLHFFLNGHKRTDLFIYVSNIPIFFFKGGGGVAHSDNMVEHLPVFLNRRFICGKAPKCEKNFITADTIQLQYSIITCNTNTISISTIK